MSLPRTKSTNTVAGFQIAGLPNNQDIVMWDTNKDRFTFVPVGSANLLLSALNINVDKSWNTKSIINLGLNLDWTLASRLTSTFVDGTSTLKFTVIPGTFSGKTGIQISDASDASVLVSNVYGGKGIILTNSQLGTGDSSLVWIDRVDEILPASDSGTLPISQIFFRRNDQAGAITAIVNRPLFQLINNNTIVHNFLIDKMEILGDRVRTATLAEQIILPADDVIANTVTSTVLGLRVTLPAANLELGVVTLTYELWVDGAAAGEQPFNVSISEAGGGDVFLTKCRTSQGVGSPSQVSFTYITAAIGQTIDLLVENTGTPSGNITVEGASGTGGNSKVTLFGVK